MTFSIYSNFSEKKKITFCILNKTSSEGKFYEIFDHFLWQKNFDCMNKCKKISC